MAYSGRRHSGPRCFLKGTTPPRGFVVDGRSRFIDRGVQWRFDQGTLTGNYPDADHDQLLAFVQRLHEKIQEYRLKGPAAFLKLSGVEKVGGATWSLPAVAACPVLDESCVDCYALAGFYNTNLAAQVGRVMRQEYLQAQIRQGDLGQWIGWMTETLHQLRPGTGANEQGQRFFRWHDSGDVFHETYARAILAVCQATPDVSHWLPTRSIRLMEQALAAVDNFPENLSITVSCVRAGQYETQQLASVRSIKAMHPDAKVTVTYTDLQPPAAAPDWGQFDWVYGQEVAVCPVTSSLKSEQRSCAGCRRCWDQHDTPTVYIVKSA